MKIKFESLKIAATANNYLQTEDRPYCLVFGKQILAKELSKAITKATNIKPIHAFALVQGNRPSVKYCSSMQQVIWIYHVNLIQLVRKHLIRDKIYFWCSRYWSQYSSILGIIQSRQHSYWIHPWHHMSRVSQIKFIHLLKCAINSSNQPYQYES